MEVNGSRLWSSLQTMAKVGGTEKGGVCRVTLTDEDEKGRNLFISWCREIGCSIRVDAMGNIFSRYNGKNQNLPAILIGSHLDSQPTGGKYDGVMGVLAGLEVCRTLHDQGMTPDRSIEIVSWTNEEGARFNPAMIGSGVFAGEFKLDYAYNLKDQDGITLGEALKQIGYKGGGKVFAEEFSHSIEFHIEQGPILEKENIPIGVVTGVQGIRWYDIHIEGKECHAGPTPMNYRNDPVQILPELLSSLYNLSNLFGEDSRITVGFIEAEPGVKNTVPGSLKVSLDIRHPDKDVLEQMNLALNEIVESNNAERERIKLEEIWHSPPVKFHDECVKAVQTASEDLNYPYRKLVSGAGHDSVYVSRVIPTSMIFIPCKDGLSHNELESVKKEHVTMGANVLLKAVMSLL